MGGKVNGCNCSFFPEFVIVETDGGGVKMVPERVCEIVEVFDTVSEATWPTCTACDSIFLTSQVLRASYCPACGAKVDRSGYGR